MANYQIDQLTLVANGDKYTLTGVCNNWGVDNGASVIGTSTFFRNIKFDVAGLNPDEKILLSYAGLIDFSQFSMNSTDLMDLIFHQSFLNNVKKGGIVIKNTNYPPPNNGHGLLGFEDFIKKFQVEQVQFNRDRVSGLFDVNIKIISDNSQEEYSVDPLNISQYIPYYQTGYSDILTFKVKEWAPGSNSGTPLLQYPPIRLGSQINSSNFPEGFPVTIIKTGQIWSEDINRKIMCVYIE